MEDYVGVTSSSHLSDWAHMILSRLVIMQLVHIRLTVDDDTDTVGGRRTLTYYVNESYLIIISCFYQFPSESIM